MKKVINFLVKDNQSSYFVFTNNNFLINKIDYMKTILKITFILFNTHLLLSQTPNIEWVKTYRNISQANIREISVDKSGNILVVGHFYDSLNYFTGVNNESIYSNGSLDMFVQKLDNQGNILWTKSIGGSNDEIPYGIDSDEFGNIYVTGRFTGAVNFGGGATNSSLTSTGTIDGFVLKLSENGSFIWVKRIGGQLNTIPMKLDYGNSNLYITGGFEGNVDFDPSTNTNNKTSNGTKDFFLLKLDQNGLFNWVRTFGGSVGENGFSSIVDTSGFIYSVGYFFSQNLNYQINGQNYTLQNNGSHDIFVTKTDFNGQTVWMKGFGGSGSDIGYDISFDSNGNLSITGQIQDTCYIGNNLLIGKGVDILISKLDINGNVLWAENHGGNNTDIGYSMCIDNQDNLFISGYFQDTINTIPTPIHSNGLQDFIILQLNNSNGNYVSHTTFGGTYIDLSHAITCDNENNVFSVGFFHNNFNLEVNSIVQNFDSSGDDDGVLLKISGFSETTNIEKIDNSINVYPNPTNGEINVCVDENQKKFHILNSQGQILKMGQINNCDVINLSDFNSGAYFLRLNDNSMIKIFKQ